MGRRSSGLERPKLTGEPGQARQFKRAGVVRRTQGGGDTIPSGWCCGGQALI